MNTPPKRRRYTKLPARNLPKGTVFIGTVEDAGVAKEFAHVMTSFVYLEERMASVLAVLLGSSDKIAASYVMRAIKSPTGRIDVMKELLEKAPINKSLGGEYDHIIREFRSISAERNIYAHGRWWTDYKTRETFLDETDDPIEALHVRRTVTQKELNQLGVRMLNLHGEIAKGPEAELKKRQQKSQPPRRAPSASKRTPRNARK